MNAALRLGALSLFTAAAFDLPVPWLDRAGAGWFGAAWLAVLVFAAPRVRPRRQPPAPRQPAPMIGLEAMIRRAEAERAAAAERDL